jgi:hypothetical protein
MAAAASPAAMIRRILPRGSGPRAETASSNYLWKSYACDRSRRLNQIGDHDGMIHRGSIIELTPWGAARGTPFSATALATQLRSTGWHWVESRRYSGRTFSRKSGLICTEQHGPVWRAGVFKTAALNHSATLPAGFDARSHRGFQAMTDPPKTDWGSSRKEKTVIVSGGTQAESAG